MGIISEHEMLEEIKQRIIGVPLGDLSVTVKAYRALSAVSDQFILLCLKERGDAAVQKDGKSNY